MKLLLIGMLIETAFIFYCTYDTVFASATDGESDKEDEGIVLDAAINNVNSASIEKKN